MLNDDVSQYCSHAKCSEPGCERFAKASTEGDWRYCKGHQRVHGLHPRDYQRTSEANRAAQEEEMDPLDVLAADWHTPEPLRALAAVARAKITSSSTDHLSTSSCLHPRRSITLFGPDLSRPAIHRAAAMLTTGREDSEHA